MRKLSLFFQRTVVIFIAVIYSAASPVLVFAQDRPDGAEIYTPYYDPNYVDQCDPGASGGASVGNGDSLYILGDSITVFTESQYQQQFAAKGVDTYINGSGGRAWAWGGSTQTQQGSLLRGSEAVDADSAVISQADGIVVALGSNGGVGANPIDDVINGIRKHNLTVPIWWVNTIYSTKWSGADNTLGEFNAKLQEKNGQGVSVIDWYRKVDPTGNPSTTPGNDPNSLLSDGLHPSGTGQQELASLVVSETTRGGGSASTSTGGSFSAEVWYNIKTMPEGWVPILNAAGARFGVDPAVLAALLSIETGWDTPESFASDPRRNSATATGPFQFIDMTAASYMPAPDQWATNTGANYTSATVKQFNNGTEFDADGSYAVDGNKDGKVDRATPEDAALMAAVYMRTLGVDTSTPLGDEGDYRVPRSSEANPMTVRLAGAYYNQGQGWSAPNATTPEELNALARGQNDVAHYMDQMWDVTKAGRESGVFGGYGGTCAGGVRPATGDASKYISDCGANDGNAQIACAAINELQGIPYSQENRAPATDPSPQFLDCSALVNMAVYRTYGTNLGICSAQFLTDPNYEQIDVRDIKPGDIVGKGTVCGTNASNVVGHVAIVVSYDAATQELVTVETASTRYLSGMRGNCEECEYNVGLEIDGKGGKYEWAVRYVGPKS